MPKIQRAVEGERVDGRETKRQSDQLRACQHILTGNAYPVHLSPPYVGIFKYHLL